METRPALVGAAYAFGAYLIWGFFPAYWKLLGGVAPGTIIAHRIAWSFVFVAGLLAVGRRWKELRAVLRNGRTLRVLAISTALISCNWLLFIWAVNNHHMLDASLGYYINALLNVLLGMLFLNERLRKLQWAAVALALSGMLIQLITFGSLPWIALTLAGSFAIYGLMRKKLAVDAISGLFLESLLLLPLALWFWSQHADSSAANLLNNSWQLNVYLIAAGLVTTVPLLCFIAGARRLQLSTMGFFQYIGPSCMFVFGVWLYHEPFASERLLTFGLIWLALFLYTLDAWRYNRISRRQALAR